MYFKFGEGSFVKSYKDTVTSSFIYCSFTSAFYQQISFFTTLELFPMLSKKRFFVTNFPFLTDLSPHSSTPLPPPPSLNGQNPLRP